MKARFAIWWNSISKRERRMLQGGLGIALAALLVFGDVEPVWRMRARLQEDLPKLRAQQMELEALTQEAARWRQALPQMRPEEVLQSVEKSLSAAGLRPQRLAREPSGEVRVALSGVDAAQFLQWLERTRRETRLQIRAAKLTRAGAGVDADVLLSFARAGT